MKSYTFTFIGRSKKFGGIIGECEQTVYADNENQAAFKLYDTHQDIILRNPPKVSEYQIDEQRYCFGDK